MNISYLPFKITEKFPSSIVTDYDKFLAEVQGPSSYLTKSKHWIDRATLYSLNQAVQARNVDASPKTDQIYHPLLNFFYHISLAANFFRIVKEKNKYRLQPTNIIAEYEQLNTTEKYFSLFEAFWVHTDWIVLLREDKYVSEYDIPQDDQFIATLRDLPYDKEISIGQILKRTKYFHQLGFAHIIRMLSFFGLLTYELKSLSPQEQYSKGYIKLKSIKITPFGSSFFEVLDRKRPFTLWNMPFRNFTGAEYPGKNLEDQHSIHEEFNEPFRQILATGIERDIYSDGSQQVSWLLREFIRSNENFNSQHISYKPSLQLP